MMIIRKKTSDVTSLAPELHRVTVQGIMPTLYESAKVIRISVMFSHNFDGNIISVNILQYAADFTEGGVLQNKCHPAQPVAITDVEGVFALPG